MPPGSSTVEIELSPSARGTTLRLWHRNLPGPEAASAHGAGWDHYLERLALAAAGGDPGTDPWLGEGEMYAASWRGRALAARELSPQRVLYQ